ncbi:hypothetical protein [Arthrobacter sp. MDT1-65]
MGKTLARVPWLLSELHTTAARLDKIGSSGNIESKSVSTTAPQAVNYSASLCAQELGYLVGTIESAAWAALNPHGPQLHKRLERSYAKGIRIIDAKPERFHLGKCPTEDCGEPMNPIKGEYEHHCKVCGETTIVEEFKGSKVSAAWNILCRPPEASRALAAMGLKVPVKSIKNWIQLEKFAAVGESGGHPTYRLSDIYDTAEAMAARRRVKMS